MHVTELLSLQGLYRVKSKMLDTSGLRPVTTFLKCHNVSPNLLTSINILIGLSALYFLFKNQWLFGILLLINIILDIFDGYYARIEKMETKVGNLLDHGGDFILGLLFLAKAFYVIGSVMAAFLIVLSIIDLIIVWRLNLWKEKFPSRIFMVFFMFGLFSEGLWFQLIYQPLSILFFGVKSMLARINPNQVFVKR